MRSATKISLILISVIGGAAFLYPFIMPASRTGGTGFEHSADAPIVTAVLLPLLVIVLAGSMLVRKRSSKEIAVLGLLVAVNVVMRFIPLPLGGSAMFFLIILGGYIWGSAFGFLLGSLTVLISAMWAGGFGPWVPFQMIAAGWVGMSAPLIRQITLRLSDRARETAEVAMLAAYGLVWGYLFGAIMNLWFWPYLGVTGSAGSIAGKYLVFYASTSFIWDSGRALVNLLLILALGRPVLKVFERFNKRFSVQFE